MILEAFLSCALSLPGTNYTRPPIVSWHAIRTEEDDVKAFIRRYNPGAKVFITPKGQAEKLKEDGWERVPFNWRSQEIWIQRKPKSDKAKRMIESCA